MQEQGGKYCCNLCRLGLLAVAKLADRPATGLPADPLLEKSLISSRSIDFFKNSLIYVGYQRFL